MLLAIAGTALGVAFGPDDRLELGPDDFTSAGPSIATAPEAIAWAGPVVEITAERADEGPVFVGVGAHVDVTDYLARTTYTRIDDVSFPWDANTTRVTGPDSPGAPPAELDWWLADAEGTGSATVRLPLPESAIDVVVMDPSLQEPLEVAVTVAWVQDGAFLLAIGMIAVAVGLVLAGRRVARA